MMNEKRQIELADLDWEDRERVLRLMFAKMNTGQPASNWRLAQGSSSDNRGSKRGTATTNGGQNNRLD